MESESFLPKLQEPSVLNAEALKKLFVCCNFDLDCFFFLKLEKLSWIGDKKFSFIENNFVKQRTALLKSNFEH